MVYTVLGLCGLIWRLLKLIELPIKPLSVNNAWKGKRYKTARYTRYQRDVLLLLPNFKVPSGLLQIKIDMGFSNKAADWDNPIKLFVDILQKKYGFDDKRIMKGIVTKTIVAKGQEYIKFELLRYN